MPNQISKREWLYRSAFELGRHLIGYELQKIFAVVDWFSTQSQDDVKVGAIGWGEGGMLALYAGAIDLRIDAVCVSGYFNSRQEIWKEPLERNVFGLLTQFGDAELAAMVCGFFIGFTTSVIPIIRIDDYGLRLLQVAPLLPYYDIDPNLVRFVGTGAWDDEVFYDEPSLSGAIYPGIEYINRKQLNDDYKKLYKEKLLRTSTLPYDLIGLLDYLINNNYSTSVFYKMLQKNNVKFAGIDGNFYFSNNKIERDLKVLQIDRGQAREISKQK